MCGRPLRKKYPHHLIIGYTIISSIRIKIDLLIVIVKGNIDSLMNLKGTFDETQNC